MKMKKNLFAFSSFLIFFIILSSSVLAYTYSDPPNLEFCYETCNDSFLRATCISNYAKKEKDPNICLTAEWILRPGVNYRKPIYSSCIQQVAVAARDISVCNHLESEFQEDCKTYYHIYASLGDALEGDIQACSKIPDYNVRQNCYVRFQSSSYCSQLQGKYRSECYKNFAPFFSFFWVSSLSIRLIPIIALILGAVYLAKKYKPKIVSNPFILSIILLAASYFIMSPVLIGLRKLVGRGESWTTGWGFYFGFMTVLSIVKIIGFSILLYILVKFVLEEEKSFMETISAYSKIEAFKYVSFFVMLSVSISYASLNFILRPIFFSPHLISTFISFIAGIFLINKEYSQNNNKALFWVIWVVLFIIFSLIADIISLIPLGLFEFG